MIINSKTKEEIEKDIKSCCELTSEKGSKKLYDLLIAKYIVIDPDFETGLPKYRTATVLGTEPDYRPQIEALCNKLKMMLTISEDSNVVFNSGRSQLSCLIAQGEIIGKEEFHEAKNGFPFSYVSGNKYNSWVAKINIFNERYLKKHPSYSEIHTLYEQRDRNSSAHGEILAQLKAVYEDEDFWIGQEKDEVNAEKREEPPIIDNKKVFIVHGHDDGAKQAVARFIEKMGFEAIILHEQPDGGKTIIEKIEVNSDVAYVIVLYTPCDLGKAKVDSEEKPRARQNVVFEHGYFIGLLGRNRVCALLKGDTEIPGDYSGVLYKKMDPDGAWKMEVLKEMKSAGIPVDAEKLLS